MESKSAFKFSREGLIELLQSRFTTEGLNDDVLQYIEKIHPFSKIEQSVKDGTITEEQVLEIVEKFGDMLNEIYTEKLQSQAHTLHEQESGNTLYHMISAGITTEDVKYAFNKSYNQCPLCIAATKDANKGATS